MGLEFYDSTKNKLDSNNVFSTNHNGTLGSSKEKLIYLRNDDIGLYFTNITVWVEDSSSPDHTLGVLGTSGWGVKISATGRQPTPDEWENILSGDSISLQDIGSSIIANTSDYVPFWIKVTVPGNTLAEARTTMSLHYRSLGRIVGS